MRLTYEETQAIKDKYGVDTIWSFSRFDKYRSSQYEYMLKYLKKLPDNHEKPSAYAVLGGLVHDQLEGLYNGTIPYEEMAENFEDIWMANIEITGLVFDRSDSDKNESIKNKYYENLVRFFKNYKQLPYKLQCERYVIIKITDDIIFGGYMDAVFKDENGFYTIEDFKTSTKYSKQALIDHSAQLVLYSQGLHQMGVPKDKIKCRFNFLKYVDVDCLQANGKVTTRSIERQDIGNKLSSSAKMWLKKAGCTEEEIFEYLEEFKLTNDITCLPQEVQDKYTFNDCYVYIDDIWGFYKTLKQEIIETVGEINQKVEIYNKFMSIGDIESAENMFWDNEESVKKQSYYYANLCGYNASTMKPYKQYLDKLDSEKNGNIFGVVKGKKVEDSNNNNNDDFDWLNEI